MSYISDFKSSPFNLFGVNGGNSSTDTSLSTLVGVKFQSADGRTFALVQNGGSALAAGVLVQGPATIGANHTGLAVATAAATGATQVSVTLGGTAVTANQYQGGFAIVSAGTGAGLTLRIASHPAQTATGGNVTLTLEDPISSNLDTSTSKVTLNLPQYGSDNGADVSTHGVIISPSAATTGQNIGVTYAPIAASSATVPTYGFIQTKGLVACLFAGSGSTAGVNVMQGAVNGAVSTFNVGGRPLVGFAVQTPEDTKKQAIFVNL